MSLEQLEAEVLALPKDSQVMLLAQLLEHLGQTSEIDREVAAVWIEKTEKRDESMNVDRVAGIPAEEVFQRVRASLQ